MARKQQSRSRSKANKSSAPQRTRTLRSLLDEVTAVSDAYEAWLDNEDEEVDQSLKEQFFEVREEVIETLAPLLEALTQARCIGFMYSPSSGAGDDDPFLTALPEAGYVTKHGLFMFLAESLHEVSTPPPPILEDGAADLSDPSRFLVIPVSGQAVFEEMWEHDGETTRVLHTRPILADSSHVEFIDSGYELLEILPTTETTYAVFGSASDEIDLRYESNHVESLIAEDRALFLGFQHGDLLVDWAARLEAVRRGNISTEPEAGVMLRGKYHQLPNLDIDAPDLNGGQQSDED